MIFRCGWRHLPYLEVRIFLGVGPGSIRTWKWFLSAGQLAIVLHILTLLKKWGALTSVFCSSVLQGLQLVYKRGDQASCKGGGWKHSCTRPLSFTSSLTLSLSTHCENIHHSHFTQKTWEHLSLSHLFVTPYCKFSANDTTNLNWM
jgi:hypothetical protein